MPTKLFAAVVIGFITVATNTSPGAITVALSEYMNGGTNGTPNAVYNYLISTGSVDGVLVGDYFRIYDVGGLTTTSAPDGWTVTKSLVDSTPPTLNLQYGDSPAVYNVTFTYTGAYPGYNGNFPLSGFICRSIYSNFTLKDFVAQDTVELTTAKVDSIGSVAVPVAVPEPTTSIPLMSAIGLLACQRRRRRD